MISWVGNHHPAINWNGERWLQIERRQCSISIDIFILCIRTKGGGQGRRAGAGGVLGKHVLSKALVPTLGPRHVYVHRGQIA
jgi:hypothetical protein